MKFPRGLLSASGLVLTLGCSIDPPSSPGPLIEQALMARQAREIIEILKGRVPSKRYNMDGDKDYYIEYNDNLDSKTYNYSINYDSLSDRSVQFVLMKKERDDDRYIDSEGNLYQETKRPSIFIFDSGVKGRCFPSSRNPTNSGPWPSQDICDERYREILDEILPIYRNMKSK